MITPTQKIPQLKSDKVYVVSGTRAEFDHYRRKKIEEGSLDDYVFVASEQTLRGLSSIKGVFIGTWKARSDILIIQREINHIKNRMSEREHDLLMQKQYTLASNQMAKDIDTAILKANTVGKAPMSITTASGSSAISSSNILTNSIKSETWFREMLKEEVMKALNSVEKK